MKSDQNLPNFIVIGPGKSGTTWLYDILRQHPSICMSTTKETMFFNMFFEKGWKWYSKFFKNCGHALSIGEVTNTYIFSKIAAKRMADFNKELKLITILRNPVDRTFSHYLFLLRNGEEKGSFEEVLNKRHDLRIRGKYYEFLNNYLKYFDINKIGIFIFDDLKKDPMSFARKVYQFLGVNMDFCPDLNRDNKLSASYSRNVWLSRLIKISAEFTRRIGFPEYVTKLKGTFLTKLLYKPFDAYPQMTNHTREKLKAYFQEDIKNLSSLINRDLVKEWLK